MYVDLHCMRLPGIRACASERICFLSFFSHALHVFTAYNKVCGALRAGQLELLHSVLEQIERLNL